MRVLVTGADGFVGRRLVGRLLETGHEVTAACRPVQGQPDLRHEPWNNRVRTVPLELDDDGAVRQALSGPQDAVVHLAAVASVREAREDPGRAWVINAAGTARVMDALIRERDRGQGDPIVVSVSSSEVYGSGPALPRAESHPVLPQSPYAASKAASEIAALEAWRRTQLRVIIARPFTHTGPGQRPPYVVPAFIERLLAVKAGGSPRVPTGNLKPVRDLLDVRDVVEAYLALMQRGIPGETYNIARGEGITLGQLFERIAEIIGVDAEPFPDPTLVRGVDIAHLVGDATKLRQATGWLPAITLDQTLQDMVNAQTH